MEPSDHHWHGFWSWPIDLSGFHFFGQPLGHQIFFLICGAVQLMSFVAAALVLFDKRRRFRLLWCFGSLIGFGKIIVNWTAGGWGIFPISFQVPALAIFRSIPVTWAAAPTDWFVAIGLPIIAIVYLILRLEPADRQTDAHNPTP